ncbi:D-aminoacyl-tRNA deacylase [Plastorhodobacter daqingensis]|uniref:D-aminoacyl-tRNA deacylase n=1 Tax=Plastorhodobacter daqingensis TaxID=1387281 RepID=A0ABW2UI00_9RHOB
MRALLQRVRCASVSVDGAICGEIDRGLLILVCAMQGDTEAEAAQLAAKIARLRIFKDAEDKMNLSLLDVGGAALVVSQFTLAADASRGNRPGFSSAAPPAEGMRLYDAFSQHLRTAGIPVANGQFGADMAVSLVNDGPVTIWLDTDTLRPPRRA